VLAFLLLAGLVGSALGQARLWPVAHIADQPGEIAQLTDSRGRVVASVSRNLMRQLLVVQDRMQQQAGFAAELMISEDRAPNAFAATWRGRRIIGITAPMLGLLGEDLDAYAALLGHEVAHHVRRHGLQRQEREQSLGLAGAIFGLALGAAGVRHGRGIAEFGTLMVSLSYTRDEEREADRLGVDWMAAAGFDPNGALRLQERLLQTGRGMPIPFLRTHPAGDERMASIRQQIAGLPPASNAVARAPDTVAQAVDATAQPSDTTIQAPTTTAQPADAEALQRSALDPAAQVPHAEAPQSAWPPPNWLPVAAPPEPET
jgi:predicted Zn-dependent protease